ncbi:hypothetical protein [Enterovibrio coralii]|uniref:hypothetical protein n=1 Tax=Enterovibrio coralii TaxID=294935 RepID=UPI001E561610|nr:hypothetical protein [Enterovibrio coralii]
MARFFSSITLATVLGLSVSNAKAEQALDYPIVDTHQTECYGLYRATTCPDIGEKTFGQDAQYQGNPPSYTNNGDGTVTDNVTGLMWAPLPICTVTASSTVMTN